MATGPRGFQGIQGFIGPPGPTGPPGPSGLGVTNLFFGIGGQEDLVSGSAIGFIPVYATGTSFDGTIFTVPSDGLYHLSTTITVSPIVALGAPTYLRATLQVLGEVPVSIQDMFYDGTSPIVGINVNAIVPLATGNQVVVTFTTSNGGSYGLILGNFSGYRVADLPPVG